MNEQNYSDFESYTNNEFSVDEKQVFENSTQERSLNTVSNTRDTIGKHR